MLNKDKINIATQALPLIFNWTSELICVLAFHNFPSCPTEKQRPDDLSMVLSKPVAQPEQGVISQVGGL